MFEDVRRLSTKVGAGKGLAVCALAFTGCVGSVPSDPVVEQEDVGQVKAQVDATEVNLKSLSYTITGPKDYNLKEEARVQGAKVSFLVANIPVGSPYKMVVDGTAEGGVKCHGQGEFDVTKDTTYSLALTLRCSRPGSGDTGGVDVDIDTEWDENAVCITGIGATPTTVAVNGVAKLKGFVSSKPDSVEWSGEGKFKYTSQLKTYYTCLKAGKVELKLTVAGHVPDTAQGCKQSQTVEIQCGDPEPEPEVDAGAGDAGTGGDPDGSTDDGADGSTDDGADGSTDDTTTVQ